MISASETTSAYLAFMSNRLASWGAACLSPQACDDHDRDEAVRAGVDAGRADAAAGRHARDDQAVDAPCRQGRGERGAEEGARILLGDDELVLFRSQTLGPGAHRAAAQEVPEHLGLLVEAAAVERLLVIDDVGQDHGHALGARGLAYPQRRGERLVHAGIEIAGRVEIGLDEIDQDQGRALAVADPVVIGAAVVLKQVFAAGFLAHGVSSLVDWVCGPGADIRTRLRSRSRVRRRSGAPRRQPSRRCPRPASGRSRRARRAAPCPVAKRASQVRCPIRAPGRSMSANAIATDPVTQLSGQIFRSPTRRP